MIRRHHPLRVPERGGKGWVGREHPGIRHIPHDVAGTRARDGEAPPLDGDGFPFPTTSGPDGPEAKWSLDISTFRSVVLSTL